jgi:hypothetical protein
MIIHVTMSPQMGASLRRNANGKVAGGYSPTISVTVRVYLPYLDPQTTGAAAEPAVAVPVAAEVPVVAAAPEIQVWRILLSSRAVAHPPV